MSQEINTRIKVWVDKGGKSYLGLGRVVLLEKILEYGSITKGAEAIHMSYRKAWQLVEDMNKISKSPLVEKRLGGKTGGGAVVTQAGIEVIRKYYELEEKINAFIKSENLESAFE